MKNQLTGYMDSQDMQSLPPAIRTIYLVTLLNNMALNYIKLPVSSS